MEPENTTAPSNEKTTCQPTNQSKPANSCETPTPDDSETSTVNPVCQPTNPYENTNSNPGRHCLPPPPPPTEVPLPPAKPRQASSRTIPVDGRPGSTLTVQDVPDQTHGMKRHTQFQSPTTSIRLETPISKNINLPKMEKVADDLETWRTRSNEKRGEYDAPIARMEASGTGLNRLTVRPVFGTPPRRPWQPWKWKAWQKARERESLASNGFNYIHN